MLVGYSDHPRVVINRSEFLGPISVDLVGPPRRLYSDGASAPPLLEQYVDEARVTQFNPPAYLLTMDTDRPWLSRSTDALALLRAAYLLGEDPQSRLTSRKAATLAHQVSLVRHVLTMSHLSRVLIADEVGLGKTIEAGLIIQGLLEQQPGLRVLYLAPARLVRNVAKEFREKLGLSFRTWAADRSSTADLTSDQFVIASIHRAVNPIHRESFAGQQQWDVLVVDEAHHLTAVGTQGQKFNRHYQLVRDLVGTLPEQGRLLLLTGTPHQGNRLRFENLTRLLETEGGMSALQKVIFRTKEDVKDWAGRPLFPARQVNSPRIVSLGPDYREWYEEIGRLYDTSRSSQATQRASAWAKGQALQWAASSVQAGLGFLVRMAIRRLGWGLENPVFRGALAALRPYRFGPPDEDLATLLVRIQKEVTRQQSDADIEDLEDDVEDRWSPNGNVLEALLSDGVKLLQAGVGTQKWELLLEFLAGADNEKVVVFAQPVETVAALTEFLERRMGERPAVIIGGQADDIREEEIQAFWKTQGPRVLVSSRAGGEGINLQVARRLIHLDVPWNPMEMEQRVGRVHRFGSRRTVIVDTIVIEGTREVDAYRIAREKLRVACGDLANDPQRFESLFARVMSLVPPDEFEGTVCGPGGALPLDSDRLGRLVEQGLVQWRQFHDEFAGQQRAIQEAAPGSANFDDLADFAIDVLDAKEVEGFTIPSFGLGDEADEGVSATPVRALRIGSQTFICADTHGLTATDGAGVSASILGINTPIVADALRSAWYSLGRSGAAWLRAPDNHVARELKKVTGDYARVVVSAYLKQLIRVAGGSTVEEGTSFHVFIQSPDCSDVVSLPPESNGQMVRLLCSCVRQKNPQLPSVGVSTIDEWPQRSLRELTRDEFTAGVRKAVWPVFSAVVDLTPQ